MLDLNKSVVDLWLIQSSTYGTLNSSFGKNIERLEQKETVQETAKVVYMHCWNAAAAKESCSCQYPVNKTHGAANPCVKLVSVYFIFSVTRQWLTVDEVHRQLKQPDSGWASIQVYDAGAFH